MARKSPAPRGDCKVGQFGSRSQNAGTAPKSLSFATYPNEGNSICSEGDDAKMTVKMTAKMKL